MTVSPFLRAIPRAGICIAVLAFAGRAEAQAIPGYTKLTFNVNLQVTNLHPTIKMAEVRCSAPGADSAAKGVGANLVNNGYTGTLSMWLAFPDEFFNSHPDHTTTATCELWFYRYTAPTKAPAVASASQPVPVTDANWVVVATGSTIKWTQVVTFPNAAAP